MKKYQKLLVTGLLLGGFTLSAAGCVQPAEPFVPPESSDGKVTINDAYDWNEDGTASNRPDLGGGYEAVLPPTAVEVTIAEGSAIRFKGGETTHTLTVGAMLRSSDFDESTLGGRRVAGVAIPGENGEILSYLPLADFSPLEAVEILPYLAPESGETVLFGSSSVGDYYYEGDGTDLDDNTDYAIGTKTAIVDGYLGRKLEFTHALSKDSYFRSVSVYAREAGQTYTYNYYLKNYGEEALALSVYQMNTGHAWANPETRTAAAPVTILAGEGKVVSVQVKNTVSNSNTLTLIKFDEGIETASLGVAMYVENTTPSRPATITLNLPAGFTVSDSYKREVRTNDKLVLPTEAQITNNTGHNLIGWVYSYANGTPVQAGVRINGDITIEPVLTEDVKIEFVNLPEGFAVKSDYKSVQQTGDRLVLPTAAQIDNQTRHKLLYWVYEDGRRANEGINLSEDIKIAPVFTEDAVITLELPENFTVSPDYNTVLQTGDRLVLPAEEQITNNTGHKIVRWLDGNGDPVTNATVLSGNISIRPELSQSATITVQLPDGLTISSDFKTDYQTGDKLIAPTAGQISGPIFNDREILGWYIVGGNNTIIDNDTIITETAVTIAPYFTRMAGTATNVSGSALVYADIQGNRKPHNVYNETGASISKGEENFDAVSDNSTVIGGGANGYAELGNVLHYNGTLKKDYRFRGGATISKSGVIFLNTTYTYYWNFENFGKTAIDFTVYGLNNGTDYTEDKTACAGVRVQLAPGESIRISYTANYKTAYQNKPNTNMMAYFYMNEEVTDLRLGVAVNVVLDENANIEDETAENVNIIVELPEGVTLKPSYRTVRKAGSRLVLPKAEDVVCTNGHNVIGWTDKDGDEIPDNLSLAVDYTIKPVLSVDVTVTVTDMPEGITLKDTYKTLWQSQDKLVLPTADDLNNTTERNLLGWTDAAGNPLTDGFVLTENITVKPIFSTPVTVTLNLPDNFTVSAEYNINFQAGDKLVLPTEEQITNETGHNILGWQDADGNPVTADTVIEGDMTISPVLSEAVTITVKVSNGVTLDESYTGSENVFTATKETGDALPALTATTTDGRQHLGWYDTETGKILSSDFKFASSVTIAPYFKADNTALTPLSGAGSGEKGCPYGPDNVTATLEGKFAKETKVGVDGQEGIKLSCSAAMAAGDAFRFKTTFAVQAKTYKYTYKFTNYGSETISFTVYQLIGSTDTDGMPSQTVTLAPGESTTVELTLSYTATNGNSLTYFVMNSAVAAGGFALGVAETVQEVTA